MASPNKSTWVLFIGEVSIEEDPLFENLRPFSSCDSVSVPCIDDFFGLCIVSKSLENAVISSLLVVMSADYETVSLIEACPLSCLGSLINYITFCFFGKIMVMYHDSL